MISMLVLLTLLTLHLDILNINTICFDNMVSTDTDTEASFLTFFLFFLDVGPLPYFHNESLIFYFA